MRTFFLAAIALMLSLVVTAPAPARDSFREGRARVILNEAIDTGVPLFNSGDANGCYQVYRGALRSILPLLADRPGLRADIRATLDRAERQRSATDRAWSLRRVLDRTLEDLN